MALSSLLLLAMIMSLRPGLALEIARRSTCRVVSCPILLPYPCTGKRSAKTGIHRNIAATARYSTAPNLDDSRTKETEVRESPYTLPNALTLARLVACPFLGYSIVQGDFAWATGLLFVSGVSDWLDGFIARKWNQRSVLGSILDPAADKALMTTLVGTLSWSGLLPVPLAVLIIGRDVALSLSAFYFRYVSLPQPRTFRRYFDPSLPSAEVKPTQISKVNTALQLLLMGITTVSPLIPLPMASGLAALQWTVAGTTIWSGLSYIGKGKGGFVVLGSRPPHHP